MSPIELNWRGVALTRSNRLFRRVNRARSWLALTLVAGLAAVFIRQQWSQFPSLRRTIGHASFAWLGVAAALQVVLLCITAATYVVVLRQLGHRVGWRRMAEACVRSAFVCTVSPVNGPVDAVVIVGALDRSGVPRDDALFAWSLVDAIGIAGGFALLAPTVLLLAVDRELSDLVLAGAAAAGIFLALVATLVGMLARGGPRSRRLEDHLPQRLTGLLDQTRAHDLKMSALAPGLALAALSEIVSILVVGAMLQAVGFGVFDPKTPLFAYEAGSAAGSLAPVYQGVGAVELAMTSMLRQQGVAPAAALAATVLYRLAGIWFPVVLGLGVAGGRRVRAFADRLVPLTTPVRPSDQTSE